MHNKETKKLAYQFKRNFEYVLAKSGHTQIKNLAILWKEKEKMDKIYYCIILTLRNFVIDAATNGSRVYKPWLVFRRSLWDWMMADSIIFLSVKLLLHFITDLRSKLILWLKPLACWKSNVSLVFSFYFWHSLLLFFLLSLFFFLVLYLWRCLCKRKWIIFLFYFQVDYFPNWVFTEKAKLN